MTDYWIKLYMEILDDPKMGTLPDRVWRRIVELFLIAGRLRNNGHLPDTRQLAWILRMNPDDLEGDMAQISSTGIILHEVNGWFIPKFEKRQGPSSDAERKQKQRERERHNQYYGDVTNPSRDVRQSRSETETETETDADAGGGENWTPYSRAFTKATNIPELTGGPEKFYKAIETMVKAGVEPEDITQAVKDMRAKNLVIASISSIVNPSIICMSKRKGKVDGKDRGVFAEEYG